MFQFIKNMFGKQERSIDLRHPAIAQYLSGKQHNKQNMLSIPEVFGACKLLCNKISTTPVGLYKETDKGGYTPARRHAGYKLVTRSPDGVIEIEDFLFGLILQSVIDGNGLAVCHRDYLGDPIELELLDAQQVIIKTEGRAIRYEINRNGKTEVRYQDDMIHIKGCHFDGVKGIPLWDLMRNTLNLSIEITEHLEQYFRKGCKPQLKYKHTKAFKNPDDVKKFKTALNDSLTNENAFGVFVCDDGSDLEPVGNTTQDIDAIVKLTEAQTRSISLLVGIPLVYLGLSDSYTSHDSLEQQQKSLLSDYINPWLVKIERQLEKVLLKEKEKDAESHFVEFDRSKLVTLDEKVLEEIWTDRLNNGKRSWQDYCRFYNIPDDKSEDFQLAANITMLKGREAPEPPAPVVAPQAPQAKDEPQAKVEPVEATKPQKRSLERELTDIAVSRLITRVKKDLNTRGVKADLKTHKEVFADSLKPFVNHEAVITEFFDELSQELGFVTDSNKIDFDRYENQIKEKLL